jgi:hypothetical protein
VHAAKRPTGDSFFESPAATFKTNVMKAAYIYHLSEAVNLGVATLLHPDMLRSM